MFSRSPTSYTLSSLFFFNDTATTEIYTLSLHDALPIFLAVQPVQDVPHRHAQELRQPERSEEHTSELQSPYDLVCRLLLETTNKERIPTRKSSTMHYHYYHTCSNKSK